MLLLLIFAALPLDPLIEEKSTGNTTILKPSEYALFFSSFLVATLPLYLDNQYKWDKIFFTGLNLAHLTRVIVRFVRALQFDRYE